MGDIGVGSILLGGLAGMLSILSPCVLPILPLILGSAITAHRFGVLALAAGLIVSFVTIGMFVTTIGFSIGLDGDLFRSVTAVALAIMGIVLLSTRLQARFALASGGLGDAGNLLLARLSPSGFVGQFVIGAILGGIWSPCVGPLLLDKAVTASRRKKP